jgi:hypothetical protein
MPCLVLIAERNRGLVPVPRVDEVKLVPVPEINDSYLLPASNEDQSKLEPSSEFGLLFNESAANESLEYLSECDDFDWSCDNDDSEDEYATNEDENNAELVPASPASEVRVH